MPKPTAATAASWQATRGERLAEREARRLTGRLAPTVTIPTVRSAEADRAAPPPAAVPVPAHRPRGRPPKHSVPALPEPAADVVANAAAVGGVAAMLYEGEAVRRKRGRPRKYPRPDDLHAITTSSEPDTDTSAYESADGALTFVDVDSSSALARALGGDSLDGASDGLGFLERSTDEPDLDWPSYRPASATSATSVEGDDVVGPAAAPPGPPALLTASASASADLISDTLLAWPDAASTAPKTGHALDDASAADPAHSAGGAHSTTGGVVVDLSSHAAAPPLHGSSAHAPGV